MTWRPSGDPGPPPKAAVLAAFGLAGDDLRVLPGGQGRAWRSGDLVLKRSGGSAEAIWRCDTMAAVAERGFRVERPVRSRAGAWAVEGWTAWRMLAGEHRADRWTEVAQAGTDFHRQLAELPRPGFLDARDDDRAHADRMTWGEERPVMASVELQVCAIRLAQSVVRTWHTSQIVHADLTGNVLFAPGAAPGIIDLTAYWRPPAFALAVVAVDAICWHGAPPGTLELVPVPERASMVARAALFRLFTADRLLARTRRGDLRYEQAQVRAADLIADLLDDL